MYRYSEDGKSFIMVDGRDVDVPRFRSPRGVHELCLVHSVDGIGVLDRSESADYALTFLGSDGRSGSGRTLSGALLCSVAFADLVGVKAFHSTDYSVEGPDGVIAARILSHLGECKVVSICGQSLPELTGSTVCEGEVE